MRATRSARRLGVLLLGCILVVAASCKPAMQTAAPGTPAAPAAPVVPVVAFEPATQLRRPVALAVVDSGTRLLVANSRSGSISLIDTPSNKVLSESAVGQGIADLVAVAGTNLILIADDVANELIAAQRAGASLESVGRIPLPASPNNIAIASSNDTVFVASSWARQISVIDISTPATLRTVATVDLPFSPRLQQILPDQRHLVALDAFGGQVAVVDLQTRQLVRNHEWTAHNLRGVGIAADAKSLLIPHQALMSDFATTQNGVHWGAVMMNVVRTVSFDALLAERPPAGAMLAYLGEQDDAAGDPTDIAVTKNQQRIVAFAGTSEIAIGDEAGDNFKRVEVGRRPTALALSPDHKVVYVANTFGDSVSFVDIDSATVLSEVTLGPQPELSLADRGELLFYDAHLSSDRWFSCHSCHVDGHSNGQLNDNFGDGSAGAPKRVLSLLGVGGTHPWAWNGKRDELEEQVRSSVLTTMRGPEPTDEQIELLTAYLKTLQPPPSLSEARGLLDQTVVDHGGAVFHQRGCADCHPAPTYTTPEVYDVGLHDTQGNQEFNPPSLRGVSQRARLFHDNRASGLAEVFTEHRHGLDEPLGEEDLNALVAFLGSL